MIRVDTGVATDAVNQSAQHILFVEGTTEGLDANVLHELLAPKIRVESLGPSYSVRSVATALHASHPHYWFVIDRDEWDDTAVDTAWKNFPDPNANNLLIWRRKELESYFLEPAWICKSRHIKLGASVDQLEQWLAREASRNLWLDAANRVLIAARNSIKQSPGSLLKSDDTKGMGREQVAEKLVASPLLANLRQRASSTLEESKIRADFDQEIELLSAGTVPLVWGKGRWRDLMDAKAVFHTMINQWFVVPDLAQHATEQKPTPPKLSGQAAQLAVAVDLLKNHRSSMPEDFKILKAVLDKQTT